MNFYYVHAAIFWAISLLILGILVLSLIDSEDDPDDVIDGSGVLDFDDNLKE
jgi:hypothetical protein